MTKLFDMSEEGIKVLRRFIKESLAAKRSESAGVVVLRKFGNEYKVLCLEEADKEKFDLTKGRIDPGEDALSAAIRETYEESGIDDIHFVWGYEPVRCCQTLMYVAVTDQDPVITANPHTGQLEHLSAKWSSFDEAKNIVKKWLVPAIEYAELICAVDDQV